MNKYKWEKSWRTYIKFVDLAEDYYKKYPESDSIHNRTLREILGYPKLIEIIENANGRRIIFKYNEEFTECTWEYVEEEIISDKYVGINLKDAWYYEFKIKEFLDVYNSRYPNDEPIYHRTLAEILGYPKLLEILENANGRRIIFKYNEEFTECTWEYVEE